MTAQTHASIVARERVASGRFREVAAVRAHVQARCRCARGRMTREAAVLVVAAHARRDVALRGVGVALGRAGRARPALGVEAQRAADAERAVALAVESEPVVARDAERLQSMTALAVRRATSR